MKTNLSILATLALSGRAVASGVCTTGSIHTAQSRSNTITAWLDQLQSQTAPSASADTKTQSSFSGMVVKAGEHYVLKTDKMTYQVDDETKAKQFEGKEVTVNGTLDKSTGVIRVTEIQPTS